MAVQSNSEGLSQEQMDRLYSDGFLEPRESVLDRAAVDLIADRMLAVMRNKDVHPVYKRHSVRDWHLVFPELIDFVSHKKVLGQLISVMGEDLILWRSHVFFKLPGTGPVGWHQDFGTFSGEDIGNNKVSLLPTHIAGVSEESLTNYLPEALSQKNSQAAPDNTDFWNMTVWVALSDITNEMGPLRFLRGSHSRRYPVRMRDLVDSDFWQDPFVNVKTRKELIDACMNSTLVLDVDTSSILEGTSVETSTYEELKSVVLERLRRLYGSATVTDEIDNRKVESFPMSKGSYLLFSERIMHGSGPNVSAHDRLAINFRVATSSTLVYPSRLKGDFVDGFNIDIRDHRCILLSGRSLNEHNRVVGTDLGSVGAWKS